MAENEQDLTASEELAELVEAGSAEDLEEFIETHAPSEMAYAMSCLTEEQQEHVLTKLPAEEAADLVESLPDAQVVGLIEHLEPTDAAAILTELPSDECADVLGDLEASSADAILEAMDPEDADAARELTRYEDDVAGGLMVTELLRYRDYQTVEDVVEDMRSRAELYHDYDVQYAYVCDRDGRLTGVLRLRDLLLSSAAKPLADIMIREPLSVRDDTGLDELADFFDGHHFLGVPVVDDRGALLGVVRQSAVDEAREAQRDDEFLKTQGLVSEEIRSMPLLRRSRRRLAWLSVNILLNVAAASVIAAFQDTLSAVIALAVFLPIISDMSGCSGSQAVAVSLRELALGLVRPNEVFRVWMKEVSVGLLNGLALGLLIGAVAFLWKGNPYLGVVVGTALGLNTIVAVSIGGLVPLLLKRWGVDPALASGPILTTITDMCGFLLVLGLATLMLERLVG